MRPWQTANATLDSWHSFANCFIYNLTLCGHNIAHRKTKNGGWQHLNVKMWGSALWIWSNSWYDKDFFGENSYQTLPGMGRCPELLVFQIFTRCLRSSWSNAPSLTSCTAIRFPGWLAFVWRPREIDSYGRANEERRRIEIGSEEWDNDRFGTFDFGIFGNSFLQWNWRCHRLIKVKTSKHPGCLGRTQQKQGGSLAEWKVGTRKKQGRRRVWWDEGRDSRGPKNIGQNLLLLLVGGNAAVVAPLHGVPNTLIQNHPAASVFVGFWHSGTFLINIYGSCIWDDIKKNVLETWFSVQFYTSFFGFILGGIILQLPIGFWIVATNHPCDHGGSPEDFQGHTGWLRHLTTAGVATRGEGRPKMGRLSPSRKKGGKTNCQGGMEYTTWNMPTWNICLSGFFIDVFLEYTTWKVDGGATP